MTRYLICFFFFSSQLYGLACSHPGVPLSVSSLEELERQLKNELDLIRYKKTTWKHVNKRVDQTYDVAIIGGGLSGLTAAAALYKEGITHLQVYDENPEGCEGPWISYAKVATLRSKKYLMATALGIPSLTFQAWYIAQFGVSKWDTIVQATREQWMDYLVWYRKVLNIPVQNSCKLVSIIPALNHFELQFLRDGLPFSAKARKVVMAGGRCGFGEPYIPDFAKKLPERYYNHTYRPINFAVVQNKDVAVIGCGASASDAAWFALENGARSVKLIMRRKNFPTVHGFARFSELIYHEGFYAMDDPWKVEVIKDMQRCGIPPHGITLNTITQRDNFEIVSEAPISDAIIADDRVILNTPKGDFHVDFMILATGPLIDGSKRPELAGFYSQIELWDRHLSQEELEKRPYLGRYPYLGPSFEFREDVPGTAPYLANLHCFNHGSALSHGVVCAEIPAISIGAERLARGIAMDFFKASFRGRTSFYPDDDSYRRMDK